eukprot:m.34453 g.34453  ORF g.34453 m.34453 type:complete len:92 (-) comp11152_c0_seq1:325-600(-)
MDARLQETLRKTMATSGVVGVMVVDRNGLCIASQGDIAVSKASAFAHLADTAAATSEKLCTTCIETEAFQYMLQQTEAGVTTVIKKKNKYA